MINNLLDTINLVNLLLDGWVLVNIAVSVVHIFYFFSGVFYKLDTCKMKNMYSKT